jgi:hypothetical protein
VPSEGAGDLAGGTGVDPGREVRAVAEGALAAIAGPVALGDFAPEPLRDRLADQAWMAERVLAHEAVLRRCVERGPVVPMRFATVVTDEAAVRTFLTDHEVALHHALEDLRGRQEWGVKAYVDWARLRARLRSDEPDDAEGDQGTGAAYFTRRRRERQGRTRAQEVARGLARHLHDALAAVAERATLLALREPGADEPQEQSMVLNGAFLVAEERLGALHETAARFSEDHEDEGFRVEVTGPWPPYSFVDLAVREAAG